MVKLCVICDKERAILKRPKTAQQICKSCFYHVFETEIHHTIVDNKLFKRGDRVAIAASGGKGKWSEGVKMMLATKALKPQSKRLDETTDSTVLAHIMKTLNDRYDYGLDLSLLSVDEGITGYRDDSLETVKRNQQQYELPLKIVSYQELYNWSMDDIVKEVGLKNNCTFCGVFRRQALDRGAVMLGVDHIVTGHNADDIAETVLMNSEFWSGMCSLFDRTAFLFWIRNIPLVTTWFLVLRGDIARLQRCTEIITSGESMVRRSKPFKYTYEKEIVMYAYFKKLDYFSTECIYSPNAYRGHARTFLKDLEAIRPSAIIG